MFIRRWTVFEFHLIHIWHAILHFPNKHSMHFYSTWSIQRMKSWWLQYVKCNFHCHSERTFISTCPDHLHRFPLHRISFNIEFEQFWHRAWLVLDRFIQHYWSNKRNCMFRESISHLFSGQQLINNSYFLMQVHGKCLYIFFYLSWSIIKCSTL